MTEPASIPTANILKDLGFTVDQSVISDGPEGMSYDFGNFKLGAGFYMNLRFAKVVNFSGVLADHRSIASVEFELPLFLGSYEECAAFIVWNLDRISTGQVFKPQREVAWLQVGRDNLHLLPWYKDRIAHEKEQADYLARPQCEVEKDWLKLALKSLACHLSSAEDSTRVEVRFDGKILIFRIADNLVALAAKGLPWGKGIIVEAGKLRMLPKRLGGELINVSLWRSRLYMGSYAYEGVCE